MPVSEERAIPTALTFGIGKADGRSSFGGQARVDNRAGIGRRGVRLRQATEPFHLLKVPIKGESFSQF